VFVKSDHKERGGELDFKFAANFVDGPQLLEGLVGETEHVVLLVKLPKQNSRCIFCLVWYDLFVAPKFEVITSGNVCSLVERCPAIDERLKVVHLFPPLLTYQFLNC